MHLQARLIAYSSGSRHDSDSSSWARFGGGRLRLFSAGGREDFIHRPLAIAVQVQRDVLEA